MLSDREVQGLVESLLRNDVRTSEVEAERTKALDYYLGTVEGDEGLPEGKSRIRSGAVLEAVEGMMPGLARIFAEADNIVEFAPRSAADVDAARQESDRVSYCYWKQNDGYLNTLSFIKDSLLSKNGIFKVWWDENGRSEREEYDNLTQPELMELLQDTSAVREVIEFDQAPSETGELTFNVVFDTKPAPQVRVMVVPPEEFGVLDNTESPNVQDARGAWHRAKRMRSDLIEDGYDRDLVWRIPEVGESSGESIERIARYGGTLDGNESDGDIASQEVWVTEYYGYIDRDEDDIAELLRVTIGGRLSDNGSGIILNIEEVDRIPFAAASPIILTHQFYGLSIADLVMGPEDIKTAMLRGIIDNVNLSNHQRTAINDNVNQDDLMSYRPGGAVRVAGEGPPGNAVMPIPTQSVPQQSFQLLQVVDEMIKGRTGASEEASLLDSGSLANINVGTAVIARDQARAKSELIARTLAELAFAPLFRMIRELLMKHQDRDETLELRGEWVEMNPSSWRERKNMTVMVGVGHSNKERRLMALGKVLERQSLLGQMGAVGSLLSPTNIYDALTDEAELLGLPDGSRYYMDPATAQPAPEKPDPQMQALQMQMALAKEQNQVSMAKVKVDAAKVQSTERLQQLQIEQKAIEARSRQDIEAMKLELAQVNAMAGERDSSAKAQAEMQRALLTAKIDQREMLLKANQEDAKREQEQYRTEMQAAVKLAEMATAEASAAKAIALEPAQPDAQAAQANDAAMSMIEELRASLEETRAELDKKTAPKSVIRDADGVIRELVSEFGSQAVNYDDDGNIASIG